MRSTLFILSFLFGVVPANSQPADALLGDWLTDGGKARVNIFVNNSKYQGKITWVPR